MEEGAEHVDLKHIGKITIVGVDDRPRRANDAGIGNEPVKPAETRLGSREGTLRLHLIATVSHNRQAIDAKFMELGQKGFRLGLIGTTGERDVVVCARRRERDGPANTSAAPVTKITLRLPTNRTPLSSARDLLDLIRLRSTPMGVLQMPLRARLSRVLGCSDVSRPQGARRRTRPSCRSWRGKERCCQSNANSSPLRARIPRRGNPQLMTDCHPASAAERRSL